MTVKCHSCSAQHEFPFFFCPNCGTAIVRMRVSPAVSSLEIYSVSGPWKVRLVVLSDGMPVDEIRAAEVTGGEILVEVTTAGRSERRKLLALEVYKCIIEGSQAIQWPSSA